MGVLHYVIARLRKNEETKLERRKRKRMSLCCAMCEEVTILAPRRGSRSEFRKKAVPVILAALHMRRKAVTVRDSNGN